MRAGLATASTVGAVRAGDAVRAVLADGSLGWSTVYAVMHRAPRAHLRHVALTLAAANATLRVSHEHLLPLARGGVRACAATAAEQAWLPAAAAAAGDALWAALPAAAGGGGGGGEGRLVCTPISAVGEHTKFGYAAPLTFSSFIVVDGVAAAVWAAPFHPLAAAWRRRRHRSAGDGEAAGEGAAAAAAVRLRGMPLFFHGGNGAPTPLWFAFRVALFDAPFRALYLCLAAARAALPASWQAAAASAADDAIAFFANARLDYALAATSAAVDAAADGAGGPDGSIATAHELALAALAAARSCVTGGGGGGVGGATALAAALAGSWLLMRKRELTGGR